MENAIKKAVEGGYEPFKTVRLTSADKIVQTDFQTLTLYHQGTEAHRASINLYRVFLDPKFWQCLVKGAHLVEKIHPNAWYQWDKKTQALAIFDEAMRQAGMFMRGLFTVSFKDPESFFTDLIK